MVEKTFDYYNSIYSRPYSTQRYTEIYEHIGDLVKDKSVLDIGCGAADLSLYITNYTGFDFSKKAINQARQKTSNVKVADLYTYSYTPFDYYVLTEVMEHINDLKAINLFPKGQNLIFSVPSFDDKAHLRVYDERFVYTRYSNLLDIKSVVRFNWYDGMFSLSNPEHKFYILLVEAQKE